MFTTSSLEDLMLAALVSFRFIRIFFMIISPVLISRSLAGDVMNREPPACLYSPLSDNAVHAGWRAGGGTHAAVLWGGTPKPSALLRVFCQNNFDSMLMLARRRVPMPPPVLEQLPYVPVRRSHMSPFPLSAALKGPGVNEGKINRLSLSSPPLNVFLCSKASAVGKRAALT